jgi:hypothetical protein
MPTTINAERNSVKSRLCLNGFMLLEYLFCFYKAQVQSNNSDMRGKLIFVAEAVVSVKFRAFGDLQCRRKVLIVGLC